MQRVCTTWFPKVSTTLLCCISVSLPVLAAPPSGKFAIPSPRSSPRPSRLDLRPPLLGDGWASEAAAGDLRRGVLLREDGFSSDDRHSFSAFETEDRRPAIVGKATTLARRLRHEGLPIARLWENHSAFVSLGLNGRGKPGLWLVQKTH